MMRMPHRNSTRDEGGSALVVVLATVVVCGALAMSAILPNIARHREAQASTDRERAFHLSEAGIDWGIAEVRKASGLPSSSTMTRAPGNGTSGSFVVAFTSGSANGIDDDGDGITDEAGESELIQLVSTGVFGDARRTIRVMMRRAVTVPTITSAIQFNVENPILDLRGNSFYISGIEHLIDRAEDLTRASVPAISAPAVVADLAAQIPARNYDQVVGAGGTPSVGYADPIDLATLVEQAKAAATTKLSPGTYTTLSMGTPTAAGVEVVVCEGDLHVSGQMDGAGILVVDGDLFVSGQMAWVGIIIVRGRCTMTGGGTTKHLVGSVIIGEELLTDDGTTTATVGGQADLLFSSDAIQLAQQRLAFMVVLSWQEVANP